MLRKVVEDLVHTAFEPTNKCAVGLRLGSLVRDP
jgi:hypothetical protein